MLLNSPQNVFILKSFPVSGRCNSSLITFRNPTVKPDLKAKELNLQ